MNTADKPAIQQFTEEDSQRVVGLLNFVATHAEFRSLKVSQVLELTKLLNWAQTQLLPKMDAHRFEVLDARPAVREGKKK